MKIPIIILIMFLAACGSGHTHEDALFEPDEFKKIELSFKRELVYSMQLDTNNLVNLSIEKHTIKDFNGVVGAGSYKTTENRYYYLIGLYSKEFELLQMNTLIDSLETTFKGDSLVMKNDSLYFHFSTKSDSTLNNLSIRYSIENE